MIGCVAYTLCYAQHPFQEAQKLSICNAQYFFPSTPVVPDNLKDLIRLCLIPNPNERPNILKLMAVLDNYYQLPEINLPKAAE